MFPFRFMHPGDCSMSLWNLTDLLHWDHHTQVHVKRRHSRYPESRLCNKIIAAWEDYSIAQYLPEIVWAVPDDFKTHGRRRQTILRIIIVKVVCVWKIEIRITSHCIIICITKVVISPVRKITLRPGRIALLIILYSVRITSLNGPAFLTKHQLVWSICAFNGAVLPALFPCASG